MKGNQGTLRDDVELFAPEQEAVAFENASVSQDTTVEGDHGRIETRTTTVFHDIGSLQKNHQWPGLKSLIMVESERETNGKVETETRFSNHLARPARQRPGTDDPAVIGWSKTASTGCSTWCSATTICRVRTDNAPFNLAIVKHIALNVLRTGNTNSLRMRRKVAAWDENALAAYIAA